MQTCINKSAGRCGLSVWHQRQFVLDRPQLTTCSGNHLQYGFIKAAPLVRPHMLAVHAGNDAELELAVFRFTLGIPGFDDTYIPRVVGSLGLLILLANHLLGPNVVADTQTRSEVLAAALASLCIASPTIEARLKELEPGRGRQATPQQVQGATSIFAILDDVTEDQKQELAWASYALLRNTNTCGVLLFDGNRAVMARGAMGPAANTDGQVAGTQACLQRLSKAHVHIQSQVSATTTTNDSQTAYLQDKGAISSAGAQDWAGLVPLGVNSILICQVSAPSNSSAMTLVLLSDRPRAWSRRERLWGLAVTSKLDAGMR